MSSKNKEKKKKPAVPWQFSRAKELLYKDIVDGVVDDSMPPRVVVAMRPEWEEYSDGFAGYLRTLRISIRKSQENAAVASRAVKHDRRVMIPVANTKYPAWRRSEADVALKGDLADGKHKEMKPKELHASREEYSVYPLKVFRKHIYQEVNSERQSSYWLHRADKDKGKKKNKFKQEPEQEQQESNGHYNRYFDYNYESYHDAHGLNDSDDSDEDDDNEEDGNDTRKDDCNGVFWI